MRIDMFVYNRCTSDARVLKEARTLAEAGHRVRVVAVLDATTVAEEERDGFRIVRIDRNPIHYRLLRIGRIAGGVWSRRTGRGAAGPGVPLQPAALPGSRARPPNAIERALQVLWEAARRLLLIPHKPLMYLDWYLRAHRLVRGDPPGALHAHDLNTLPVAAALARQLDVPLIYDAHELFPEISTLSRREAAVWRLLEGRLAKRADHVLTVCDSIAAELKGRYGVSTPTVLLNCPETASRNGAGWDGAIRRGGGSHGGRAPVALDAPGAFLANAACNAPVEAIAAPVVLYQGGFAPHRGLDTLIRAARGLERGTVVLMGWGRLEEKLRELLVAEDVGERVRIVGPVPREEVVAAAARADIGVIPYEPVGLNNTYTTPNKLFDYMAAGLPIAASRLPELSRFVADAGLGLTFSPGDAGSLAATLNEMLADPARLSAMADRAREAGGRYTWEQESAKLLALYDDFASE